MYIKPYKNIHTTNFNKILQFSAENPKYLHMYQKAFVSRKSDLIRNLEENNYEALF